MWAALHIVVGLPLNLLLPRPAHAQSSMKDRVGWKPRREMLLLAFVFAAACLAALGALFRLSAKPYRH